MKTNLLNAMTEPASSAAAAAGIKFGLSLGAGGLGALAMAAFDPPPTKKAMYAQAAVAGTLAIVSTKLAIKILAGWWPSVFDISNASIWDAVDVLLPVGFLIGALSWGLMGALVKLRGLVAAKGADAVAEKVGLGVSRE